MRDTSSDVGEQRSPSCPHLADSSYSIVLSFWQFYQHIRTNDLMHSPEAWDWWYISFFITVTKQNGILTGRGGVEFCWSLWLQAVSTAVITPSVWPVCLLHNTLLSGKTATCVIMWNLAVCHYLMQLFMHVPPLFTVYLCLLDILGVMIFYLLKRDSESGVHIHL